MKIEVRKWFGESACVILKEDNATIEVPCYAADDARDVAKTLLTAAWDLAPGGQGAGWMGELLDDCGIEAASRGYLRKADVAKVLSFFRSVIKSGEQWTPACAEAYNDLLGITPKGGRSE